MSPSFITRPARESNKDGLGEVDIDTNMLSVNIFATKVSIAPHDLYYHPTSTTKNPLTQKIPEVLNYWWPTKTICATSISTEVISVTMSATEEPTASLTSVDLVVDGPTTTPMVEDGPVAFRVIDHPNDGSCPGKNLAMILIPPIVLFIIFCGIIVVGLLCISCKCTWPHFWKCWKWVWVISSAVFAICGSVLTGLAANDPGACVKFTQAGITGTVYTGVGIVMAALGSFP